MNISCMDEIAQPINKLRDGDIKVTIATGWMPATKLTRYVQQCKIQPILLLMIMLTDIFYISPL